MCLCVWLQDILRQKSTNHKNNLKWGRKLNQDSQMVTVNEVTEKNPPEKCGTGYREASAMRQLCVSVPLVCVSLCYYQSPLKNDVL